MVANESQFIASDSRTDGAVRIPLASRMHPNLFAIVDRDDASRLLHHHWMVKVVQNSPHLKYAFRVDKQSGKHLYLHREIMSFPPSSVDHINGNTLDDRRCNLRIASQQQNVWNHQKRSGDNRIGVRAARGKFHADIRHEGKAIRIGTFHTAEAAAAARDRVAKELRGDFAVLNNVISEEAAIEFEWPIEKGIPIPEVSKPTSYKRFGLGRLEVGDSILVPCRYNSILAGICRAKKTLPDRKFVTRTFESGVRVWRIA